MAAGQFGHPDDTDPRDSIGQPESMRNEEQKLRDNQGGSELTDRPDDHPVGAPGETASAEAEGPPPETTLPESSPLERGFQPGGPAREQDEAGPPTAGDTERPAADADLDKLRRARVEPGDRIVPPEERGE